MRAASAVFLGRLGVGDSCRVSGVNAAMLEAYLTTPPGEGQLQAARL